MKKLVFLLLAICAAGISHETITTTVLFDREIVRILDKHCVMCHSARPTHKGVPAAPNGAMFDTAEGLRKHADKIYERAVAGTSMPLGNETGMTPAERASLGAWIKAGAKVEP